MKEREREMKERKSKYLRDYERVRERKRCLT